MANDHRHIHLYSKIIDIVYIVRLDVYNLYGQINNLFLISWLTLTMKII